MDGTLTITIDLGNDAMRTPEDIADAIEHVRRRVLEGREYGTITDGNGNKVGTFTIEED